MISEKDKQEILDGAYGLPATGLNVRLTVENRRNFMGYGLTPEFLKAPIKRTEYQRIGDTGVLCILTLHNGYTVIGESSCVDPAIFDQSIGKKFAYEVAFDKLWAIFGYQEKQRWFEETQSTWLDRVKLELHELNSKRDKLADWFMKGKPEFIPNEEWDRLGNQAKAMREYASILADRIYSAEGVE